MHVPCLFCLRTSKSFSMGEFDKCHMCMGILNDLGSLLGLNCIIIRFIYIFFRLRSVLTLSSFHCRFECVGPSYRRKARSWGQLSQEELQRKPNRPNIGDLRRVQWTQTNLKTQRSRSDGTTGPEATMVGPWYSPRTVVTSARSCCLDAGSCVPPAHLILRVPAWLFIFHAVFQFELLFWL